MTQKELREKFLNFFKEKGHSIIPSAPLIPEHDPTVLFTTAGMHPLTPFLLGEKHPAGKRLADVQKCVRTGDIDDVGDAWHLTFFEMLGNWSLGDYWKKEAIEWSFEFLTEKENLGIPLEKISITVFAGNEDAPRDEESAEVWQKLGIKKERIFYLPKEDNWWGPAGQTGPCGPCTEMFYDSGKEKCGSDCKPGCKCGKYAEIWNDVFMEFNKNADGKYEQLKQKNVDTGMGIERTTAVLNNFDNVYEIELFTPLIKKIREISGKSYQKENIRSFRIIADHLKAATFILSEMIEPGNVEQGYVLRRLIRRAIRYGQQIEIKDFFTFKIAKAVIEMYESFYPELRKNKEFIEEQLIREEEKFGKTIKAGAKKLEQLLHKSKNKKISGRELFDLYQTYGYPFEMSKEFFEQKGFEVAKEEFEAEIKKHQEISRAGAEQKFAGGLADHSEKTIKYHTAAHLLLAALRRVLGNHVVQKGSNITAERLRFDFSHSQKLTSEEIKKIENLVNQNIKKDLQVKKEEMSYQEAINSGALAFFKEKYPEKVSVYSVDNFSKEICAGPHVNKTSELGHFKIIREENCGGGARRIRAILIDKNNKN